MMKKHKASNLNLDQEEKDLLKSVESGDEIAVDINGSWRGFFNDQKLDEIFDFSLWHHPPNTPFDRCDSKL